jgi:argininosuccinate lyase
MARRVLNQVLALSDKYQEITLMLFYFSFAQLERDAGQLVDCRERLNFCPLGACALARTGLPIDKFKTAKDLKFTAPMENR